MISSSPLGLVSLNIQAKERAIVAIKTAKRPSSFLIPHFSKYEIKKLSFHKIKHKHLILFNFSRYELNQKAISQEHT